VKKEGASSQRWVGSSGTREWLVVAGVLKGGWVVGGLAVCVEELEEGREDFRAGGC
jgi:hypothetical protein